MLDYYVPWPAPLEVPYVVVSLFSLGVVVYLWAVVLYSASFFRSFVLSWVVDDVLGASLFAFGCPFREEVAVAKVFELVRLG